MKTDSLNTIAAGYEYDSQDAWGDFGWAKNPPTDSAAAGTAMATGTKVRNGALNMDPEGNELTTLSELAHEPAVRQVWSPRCSTATRLRPPMRLQMKTAITTRPSVPR